MEATLALMNAVFLTFIVSTMLSVGLATTGTQLTRVLGDALGALPASLMVVPLVGWGLAEAFPLESPTYLIGVFAVLLTTQVVVASWFGTRPDQVAKEPVRA